MNTSIKDMIKEYLCTIFLDVKLDSSEREVLKTLCLYAIEDYENGDGTCTPAIISIAKKSGFGRTKTKEVLDRLMTKGYIDKQRRKILGKKENDTNLYSILGLKKLLLGAKRQKIERQMKKEQLEQQQLERLEVAPHEMVEMEELQEFAKANNCKINAPKAIELLRTYGLELVQCAIIRASKHCKQYMPLGYLLKTIKSAMPYYDRFIDMMAYSDGTEEWQGFGLQSYLENVGFLR